MAAVSFIDITNDYTLKYFWIGYSEHGANYRLNIYQRTDSLNGATITAKEIVNTANILLEMQGAQGEICVPIIKTQLRFSLIDAPDMVVGGSQKGSDWEEFFTPDSTLYLVELGYRTNTSDGSGQFLYDTVWRGYITPDSWEEEIRYRGLITITARDNIGHLADFKMSDIDLSASVTAFENYDIDYITAFIRKMLGLIDFPMDYEQLYSADQVHLTDGDAWLSDAYIYRGAIEQDTSCLTFLESVLEGIGYCLRWNGAGKFVLLPIRSLPLEGNSSKAIAVSKARTIQFTGGTKILDPAYKRIIEKDNYEGERELEIDIFKNYRDGDTTLETHNADIVNASNVESDFIGRSFPNQSQDNSAESDGGWMPTVGFMHARCCSPTASLTREEGSHTLENSIMLATNVSEGETPLLQEYVIPCCNTDITLNFDFAQPVSLKSLSNGIYSVERLPFAYIEHVNLRVTYKDPVLFRTWYYDSETKTWSANQGADIHVEVAEAAADSYSFQVLLKDNSDVVPSPGGMLYICFTDIRLKSAGLRGSYTQLGTFARLVSFKVIQNSLSFLKSNTVTTINNIAYNVEVKRTPMFAALSQDVAYFQPRSYKKTLWEMGTYMVQPFGYNVYWSGESAADAVPLPGQIHRQILCYYHEALPVLEGDFYLADLGPLYSPTLFLYKNRQYIMFNGTFNVLRDRVDGGMLHAFYWWDDLWVTPSQSNEE